MQKTSDVKQDGDCEYIEKELDLGFYKDHSGDGATGSRSLMQAECNRISQCSCNCNRTPCILLE